MFICRIAKAVHGKKKFGKPRKPPVGTNEFPTVHPSLVEPSWTKSWSR